jgi:hypothetical protein
VGLEVDGCQAVVVLERFGQYRRAYGWAHPDAPADALFEEICGLAAGVGFESFSTYVSEALYQQLRSRYDMEIAGTEVLMSRDLSV